ncbi:MAG: DsrE/DsrF/DrsH-like family protein [Clostridium sp.]
MSKKVLIVGGVAGGASTAARLRRLDENIEIVMFERGEHISFANCGLPYYIGETITDREKLLVQTPEKMNARFNIDVRTFSEVISIDADNKKVIVRSKNDGEYEEFFDALVLSPGAKPIVPKIPGGNDERIMTLRNVWDTDKIKKLVDKEEIKDAVVIGGGFIGIEMAENLKERGLNVTLIEAAPHILAPFDSEISTIIEKEMNDNGVSLVLGDKVVEYVNEGEALSVVLESGKSIKTQIVVSAIGVVPDTDFLRESGIELGQRGHILVNEYMETNKEGVYALGDAVSVVDFVNGREAFIPLAGPANRQGRIVGDNIAGIKSSYKGSLGTSIIKVFDLAAASTGNNERTLKRYGIEYKKVYLHPMSHASYYPGATPLTIKVIYDVEGKILGAQALGVEGIDKFIDVIATTIKFGGTMEDLAELELAYAPPFSSAKSPANMAGFIAKNEMVGLGKLWSVEELDNYDENTQILLDVREAMEVQGGMIPGAINIPVDKLRDGMRALDKNKEILVYCAVGIRGYIAQRILEQNGFKTRNLTGGFRIFSNWNYKGKEVEQKEEAVKEEVALTKDENIKELNAVGLCCPGPLMQVKMMTDLMKDNEVLRVKASDPGFYKDIEAWARRTNNELLSVEKKKGIIEAVIKKTNKQSDSNNEIATQNNDKNGQTLVVFSGDLDKAIASFIIANGAASMGKKVTMFFTFWGLNILRKADKVKADKNIIEKAFGLMMPRGSEKLGLSKMNMAGIGPKMIRGVMKNKNVNSLEELIESAKKNGVELVACTMSMDVMGIKKEELIDGVNFGGVGYYLGEAEESNVNLFI